MIPQRGDSHVAEGLALLTGAFKDKAVIEGILTVLLRRHDKLEKMLWRTIWGWMLEWADPDDPSNVYHAKGQQLDDLGAIVGQPREGRTDGEYIDAIRLRARINRSKGRSEDMVQVSALINTLATYVEYFPLAWEVSIYNVTNSGDLIRLLAQAKSAASYGVLLSTNFAEAYASKFDHAGDEDHVFSSAYTPAPDVRYVSALPTYPPYRRS